MSTFNIERRSRRLVNTDPQRRCYNGAHFSSELVWDQWEVLNFDVSSETVEDKLKFWRELNDYAVSQRGDGARCEFRAVPQNYAFFASGDINPVPLSDGDRRYAVDAEKPQTTRQLIDALVKHYGSSLAVNQAVREVWQTQDNLRKMLKVDAMWVLYERIQGGSNV